MSRGHVRTAALLGVAGVAITLQGPVVPCAGGGDTSGHVLMNIVTGGFRFPGLAHDFSPLLREAAQRCCFSSSRAAAERVGVSGIGMGGAGARRSHGHAYCACWEGGREGSVSSPILRRVDSAAKEGCIRRKPIGAEGHSPTLRPACRVAAGASA